MINNLDKLTLEEIHILHLYKDVISDLLTKGEWVSDESSFYWVPDSEVIEVIENLLSSTHL
jgi:hypothetical protein